MRHDPRPKVMHAPRTLDRVLEAAAVLALAGMWGYAVLSYSGLPDRVPVHFDFAGKPDRWGPASTVFLLPVIACGLYVVMTVAGVIKPWYWNIPARVTEENASRVYGATARLLRLVKLEATLLMGVILWLVVRSAHDGRSTGAWAPIACVGVMMTTVLTGIVLIRRRAEPRKSDGAGGAAHAASR